MLSSKIRPAVLAIACVTFTCPKASAAEYLLTASGPFLDLVTHSLTWDGTNLGVLPPILDLDRLAGGSFTATYLFSPDTSDIFPNEVTYRFSANSMLTFDLLDVSGQLVHHGSYTSEPNAFVSNNVDDTDTVILEAFGDINSVTGSHLPPPIYSPALHKFSYVDLYFDSFGADLSVHDYITNLELPTDAATYLAFPRRFFSLISEVGDGDFSFRIEPYQSSYIQQRYEITALTVTAVPEPASFALLLLVGVAWLGSYRRRC